MRLNQGEDLGFLGRMDVRDYMGQSLTSMWRRGSLYDEAGAESTAVWAQEEPSECFIAVVQA